MSVKISSNKWTFLIQKIVKSKDLFCYIIVTLTCKVYCIVKYKKTREHIKRLTRATTKASKDYFSFATSQNLYTFYTLSIFSLLYITQAFNSPTSLNIDPFHSKLSLWIIGGMAPSISPLQLFYIDFDSDKWANLHHTKY